MDRIRYDVNMKKSFVLLLGLLFCGFVVSLQLYFVFIAKSSSAPPVSFSSSQCESAFPSYALQWLSPESFQRPLRLCVEDTDLSKKPVLLPDGLRCALPRAYLVDSKCDVSYRSLTSKNAFVQKRQAEVDFLMLRTNRVLFLKVNASLNIFEGISLATWGRMVDHDSVWYAFKGDASSLVLKQPPCSFVIALEPKGDPPIWLVMWQRQDENSPFVKSALEYCKKQGYGMINPFQSCFDKMDIAKSWRKIGLVKFVIEFLVKKKANRGGWVLWLDENALITNLSKDVESIVTGPIAGPKGLLLLGQDPRPPYLVNSNVFLAKVARATLRLIDSIWGVAGLKNWRDSAFWEQNAIAYLLDQGRREREYAYWHDRIRPVPHRVLLSVMRHDEVSVKHDFRGGHWRPGDFIALIGGVSRAEAVAQAKAMADKKFDFKMEKLPNKIIHVPPLYACRLDTYFGTSEPTFLEFEGKLHNETWEINPSCVWRDNYESLECVVRSIPYNLNIETGEYVWPNGGTTGSSIVVMFTVTAKQHHESPGDTIVIRNWHDMEVPVNVTKRLTAWIPMSNRKGWFRYVSGGWEDMKLMQVEDQLYGFCTCHQLTKYGACEMVMVPLSKEQNMIEAYPMRGYKPACHKNWMPFLHQGKVHLVEKPDPLVILSPDMKTGRVTTVLEENKQRYVGLDLRGTSNGLKFHNGYLFIVHETLKRGKEYVHRFMYMDETWKYRQLSRPFYFVRYCVEFGISMTLLKDKSKIVIGFGQEDKRGAFMNVDIGSPKAFLEDPIFWNIK